MICAAIDHVPNAISVRSALTARDVHERATLHAESCDPTIVEPIVHAIHAMREFPAARTADLRYAIRLRDAHGRITRIYMDAFGLRGLVDGRPVRFANDAIKRAIVTAFPQMSS